MNPPTRPRSTWYTLGDIAETLQQMKDQGMTRAAVLYAVDRVFFLDETR